MENVPARHPEVVPSPRSDEELREELTDRLRTYAESWLQLHGNFTCIVGSVTDNTTRTRIAAGMSFIREETSIGIQYIEIDIATQKPAGDYFTIKICPGDSIPESTLELRHLLTAAHIANPLLPDTRRVGLNQFEQWIP